MNESFEPGNLPHYRVQTTPTIPNESPGPRAASQQ